MIHLKDLQFSYGAGAPCVLNIPELRIEKGERVFLYGASGSGKSTLLEILAGVLVPNSGKVEILDKDLTSMSSADRDWFRSKNIGYIFQSFNLIPYLSVTENIILPSQLAGVINVDETRVKRLVDQLGIQSLLERKVTQLSVGQQQRVAVARALLSEPSLLLADEPTSSLDYDHREKFIRLLFELCAERKMTVLFVSHDRSLEGLFSKSLSMSQINRGPA